MRVLLIESSDEMTEVRKLFIQGLASGHAEIIAVTKLEDAMLALKEHQSFDLCVLDLVLSDSSAENTIDIFPFNAVPTIVISTTEDLSDAWRCLLAGALYYFRKTDDVNWRGIAVAKAKSIIQAGEAAKIKKPQSNYTKRLATVLIMLVLAMCGAVVLYSSENISTSIILNFLLLAGLIVNFIDRHIKQKEVEKKIEENTLAVKENVFLTANVIEAEARKNNLLLKTASAKIDAIIKRNGNNHEKK